MVTKLWYSSTESVLLLLRIYVHINNIVIDLRICKYVFFIDQYLFLDHYNCTYHTHIRWKPIHKSSITMKKPSTCRATQEHSRSDGYFTINHFLIRVLFREYWIAYHYYSHEDADNCACVLTLSSAFL